MSLFKSLFPLARENSLTVLIVAEGEQLRVNVMPKSKDEKAEKTLYPLSLLATPEELDRDFAEAIEIYSPGSQSVIEQARTASAANSPKGSAPAPAKGKPGRKGKPAEPAAPAVGPEDASGGNEGDADDGAPPVDPRQIQIPGLGESEGEVNAATEESPVAERAQPVSDASRDAADDAVDLL